MIILWIALFIKVVSNSEVIKYVATTPTLAHIEELPNVALFNDGQHRGPNWYSAATESEEESDYTSSSEDVSDESDDTGSESTNSDVSTSASSFETKERKFVTRTYRVCHPCPHDMLKKFNNRGIKWICGGYQRARRSFKSDCMMRYRNCEDGTMFVKIYDHRCKNDTYHGKHWFYFYRT